MRRLLTVLAFFVSFSAHAADLAVKARAPAAAPVFSWTGFYVGGSIGYLQSTVNAQDPNYLTVDVSNWQAAGDSVMLGGDVGYNYQIGSFVIGVEADLSYVSAETTYNPWRSDDGRYISEHSIDSLGTVRARLGYAFDRALLYVTGGLAYAKVKNSAYGWFSGSAVDFDEWKTGWTVGGGLEYALTNNWTIRGEALYADLGSQSQTLSYTWYNYSYSGVVSFDNTVVLGRLGVNYKF